MVENLQHRNYFQIAENNIEFIRGDIWDFEIVGSWPLAVYNPGIDIFKKRLKSINFSMDNGIHSIHEDILDNDLTQNMGRNAQSVDVTLDFTDREDQAMTFMINDWLNQIGDPITGFGRHKKELIFTQCQLNIYNTLLQKIRYYQFYNGTLSSTNLQEAVGNRGTDLSSVSITIHFELALRKII